MNVRCAVSVQGGRYVFAYDLCEQAIELSLLPADAKTDMERRFQRRTLTATLKTLSGHPLEICQRAAGEIIRRKHVSGEIIMVRTGLWKIVAPE